jgi:hypothetical protein
MQTIACLAKERCISLGPEHTAAFFALKNKMFNAPILALTNFSLPFTLEYDASGSGIGAVLM